MNISCIICTDCFLPQSETFSTTCGHIFHHACLLQWIERSKSCPQCRCKTTEKSIHRVFLHDNSLPVEETAGQLKDKLNSLELHCQKVLEAKNTIKERNKLLRQEVMKLEDQIAMLESSVCGLKEQVTYYKGKCKDTSKLEEEVVKLKEKIQTMEDIETIMTGSSDQVKDVLKHNRDPESLHILVVTLKSELIASEKKRRMAIIRMKESDADANSAKKRLKEVQLENTTYKQQLETLRNSESERIFLKRQLKKIKENQQFFENKKSDNLDRVLFESPAPLKATKRKSDDTDLTVLDISTSPISSKANKSASELDSPYLQIKSSNVYDNINAKRLTQANATSTLPTSIFKKNFERAKEIQLKTYQPNSDLMFDGLGGHSKYDLFPTPNKVVKKVKTSSTISSNKFKKLAPHTNQNKLNSFFYEGSSNKS